MIELYSQVKRDVSKSDSVTVVVITAHSTKTIHLWL